jgi:hypothetical protein
MRPAERGPWKVLSFVLHNDGCLHHVPALALSRNPAAPDALVAERLLVAPAPNFLTGMTHLRVLLEGSVADVSPATVRAVELCDPELHVGEVEPAQKKRHRHIGVIDSSNIRNVECEEPGARRTLRLCECNERLMPLGVPVAQAAPRPAQEAGRARVRRACMHACMLFSHAC